MIAAEIKTKCSTVRIHDDCFFSDPAPCLQALGEIVSDFYRHKRQTPGLDSPEKTP